MIGFVVKIVVVLVVGVLVYNYFFGTSEEKAQSTKAFGQMKDVAVTVGQLAKAEKEKFDAGKYDTALDKLGAAYKSLREGAQKLDHSVLKRIDELEKRKKALGKELEAIREEPAAEAGKSDAGKDRAKREEKLRRELDDLQRDSDALLRESAAKGSGK